MYPLKEVTAVSAWTGAKDKREATDPELEEHRRDNDRAKTAATRALVEVSGCGHNVTRNSNQLTD